MNTIRKPLLTAAGLTFGTLLLLTSKASAMDIHPYLGMNYDFNRGETLTEFTMSDGSTENLGSARGPIVFMGLSASHRFLEAQLALGFKFDAAGGSNGEATFMRYPLEAMLFYKKDVHRIGGGLIQHRSPEYNCDVDFICNVTIPFKDATGYALEYKLVMPMNPSNPRKTMSMGLRYTSISYTDELDIVTVDGSSYGLTMGFTF